MATTDNWRTALAYGDTDKVVIRGYDLGELVGNLGFAEAFLLLATGELPPAGHAKLLDAMFVSVLDHGIVPSSIVSRYLASSGNPLQVAVAGGVMTFGDTYGGACEQLARSLWRCGSEIQDGKRDQASAAQSIIQEFAGSGHKVPGFGHALHPHGDPRVDRLYAVADANGVTGRFSLLAKQVEQELESRKGRRLPMNQDGALAALGLDLGLDWRLARALAFVPRSAGLAVHAVEEMTREAGWRHVPDSKVKYDGPPLRPLKGTR
ncbi:citryl-CoA lyase [Zhengella mangrovi]|uniref:citrate synthase (unknown stereospecificity) n=1 Tax=Zhengella mangrovi TaxID=1982044 RepID=A0A2G1QH46_9HYPH|nr:citryl-CoA lyase [Zhengella mangrovi]PHP64836.1 citryl-CoA lyase [Zhengella mangrovi]